MVLHTEHVSLSSSGAPSAAPSLEVHYRTPLAQGPSQGCPVVLVCPGGSYKWWHGDKEGLAPAAWVESLGSNVITCILKYRLDAWPAPREDLYKAVSFVQSKEAKAKWNADGSKIALVGFSAGAHLAAQAGHIRGIRALVLCYPPYADTDESVDTLEAIRNCANETERPLQDGEGRSGGGVGGSSSSSSGGAQLPTSTATRTSAPAASAASSAPAASASRAGAAAAATRHLPAVYIVSSTSDKVCPPEEHADRIAAELIALGAATVVHQRQRLGAHGFGCVPKWTSKCGVWLQKELNIEGPAGPVVHGDGRAGVSTTSKSGGGGGGEAAAAAAADDGGDEASFAALRKTYASLGTGEQAAELVVLRGRIVGRRQGRAPRVFLDLQAGAERVQLVVEAPQVHLDRTTAASDEKRKEPKTMEKGGKLFILPQTIKVGVSVQVSGHPFRMPGRGAFSLLALAADIVITPESALAAAAPAPPAAAPALAPKSGIKRASAAAYPRYHMSPGTTGWETNLGKLHVGAHNNMSWSGGLPLPEPPQLPDGAPKCWLLPATDIVAVGIALHQKSLRDMGWRVLTTDVHVIERLSNKISFRDHAKALGLLQHLPEHYATPEDANFPCIMKGAVGNHGQNVKIIPSLELLLRKKGIDWHSGGQFLLQELIPGNVELSSSLLVRDGVVLDSVCVEYTYHSEIFVWPHVQEEKGKRISHSNIPPAHLAVMTQLLVGYSGICNFNYKIRPRKLKAGNEAGGQQIAIFEINTRVGGDLGDDVPRWRARTFFERLESI